MLAQTSQSINIPTDRDAYRAWLRGLSESTRVLLFGVAPGADEFRCPTNGRRYTATATDVHDDYIWTVCYWCDTQGRVRGESGFDPDNRQPHCYEVTT